DAQIQLAGHLEAFLHEYARNHAAFRSRLMRHERHADHGRRQPFGFFGRPGELHTSTLAATTGVNLRLHDNDTSTEAVRDLTGFGRVERDLAARNRYTVAGKNGLGLVLVDFHERTTIIEC